MNALAAIPRVSRFAKFMNWADGVINTAGRYAKSAGAYAGKNYKYAKSVAGNFANKAASSGASGARAAGRVGMSGLGELGGLARWTAAGAAGGGIAGASMNMMGDRNSNVWKGMKYGAMAGGGMKAFGMSMRGIRNVKGWAGARASARNADNIGTVWKDIRGSRQPQIGVTARGRIGYTPPRPPMTAASNARSYW